MRSEGLTRNVGDFTRFLETISFSHGGLLNIASVARDCEIGRKVVAAYVEILEDLLLAFRVPVFRKRARRQTVAHDRIYLFDAGVFRSLRPAGPLDSPSEMEGQALEGLVAQHLRAWSSYSRRGAELYFWRTRGGAEVDFVVDGEAGLHAIEVKNSTRIHRTDLRSLRTFRTDYPEAEAVALYRGEERLRIDDIWCIPAADFLRSLSPDQPLTVNHARSEPPMGS